MQPLLPTGDHLRLIFIILKYRRHFCHHHHRPPEDGLRYFEAHHMSQCCIVTCEYVITLLDVTIYKKTDYETVSSFDIATCPSNTMHFVKHVGAVLSQASECFHSFSFFSSNTEYEHEEFHSSPVKAVLCHPI